MNIEMNIPAGGPDRGSGVREGQGWPDWNQGQQDGRPGVARHGSPGEQPEGNHTEEPRGPDGRTGEQSDVRPGCSQMEGQGAQEVGGNKSWKTCNH